MNFHLDKTNKVVIIHDGCTVGELITVAPFIENFKEYSILIKRPLTYSVDCLGEMINMELI